MLSWPCIVVRAVPVLLAAIQCIRKGEVRHFHKVELRFEQGCMTSYCAHPNFLISSKAKEIGRHHVQHLLAVCYYMRIRRSCKHRQRSDEAGKQAITGMTSERPSQACL